MMNKLKILQLIDSLDGGGAERMAVNYANVLSDHILFSGIAVTRKEGVLKDQIKKEVGYLYLDKKRTFDLNALLKLKRYVVNNNICVIHAHSTSFFLAVLLKFIYPKIKIIWHDHYGNSEFLENRKVFLIKKLSYFFSGVISVNQLLLDWGRKNLKCKNIIYLPNFVNFESSENTFNLWGETDKRIVCVANLRAQKNHLMLLEVAKIIHKKYPAWSFHLLGKDFNDDYSKEIKNKIEDYNLKGTVFIYGSTNAIPSVLKQSTIGILTSLSEGLPVALLEYGKYGLPVLSTNVGEVSSVIKNKVNGILVQSKNVFDFSTELETLINNKIERESLGQQLKKDVEIYFSEKAVISKYLKFISYAE